MRGLRILRGIMSQLDYMSAMKAPPDRQRSRESTSIWFETRWGMTAFLVAVCIIGSAALLYFAIYMAWL
ncbi:MAG: hypothetical protein C0P74_009435 [Gammaproteobacteria bacterium]|nr:hypothetical protein [Gammaproteobacteria bacterium]